MAYTVYTLDAPRTKAVLSSLKVSSHLWHARFGHPSTQGVQHIIRQHQLPFSFHKADSVCDACRRGKSH